MPINEQQRRKLKKLVHHLKPVVLLGQKGLSESVINEIEIALDVHELIKIKLSGGDRDDRQSMIADICERTGAELIHTIGHMAAFFRKNPKKTKQ